ncbi:MAG TPA: type II secretion system protein, partial [Phycisphaerales bacterium]|nr:type II secretion system protein [Phycisphaerales bacterium]
MRGRGFTLIEVLIALALLVTMLSLVGPVLVGRLAPMTFDRVSGQFGAAARLTQERARLEGAVLYLYAEADEPGGAVKIVVRR